MSIFNQPDFLTVRQFDFENKLVLPTKELYTQLNFKFNALYENIHAILSDAHSYLAAAAQQFYDRPVETLATWYGQAAYTTNNLYTEIQSHVSPIHESWGIKAKEFWANPEQVTISTLEPVKRFATENAEQYLQPFLDNPEQFLANAFAPVADYLTGITGSAESILIGSYYALLDLFKLLMEQPSEALRALYQSSLSGLLDVYYQAISSLLTML